MTPPTDQEGTSGGQHLAARLTAIRARAAPWRRRWAAVLLECLARRGRPRPGQVAKEVCLGGRDARDPLDVARSGTALQGVGDRLEGGLVDVERAAPRSLARVDDPLVEFANPLLGRLDAGLGGLRLSGRWWRPRPCSSGLRGTSRGLGGPGPCSRASLLLPSCRLLRLWHYCL